MKRRADSSKNLEIAEYAANLALDPVGADRDCYGYNEVMCLICVELAKNAMTAKEARRALGEMRVKLDAEHVAEVEAKVAEAERAGKPRP